MKYDFSSERDELRGRFTRFMEVTLKHARLNYIKKLSRFPKTVSLDEIPETSLATYMPFRPGSANEFVFEEERLACAFQQLPLMRQRILMLLFVEELTPAEIAKRMNCSVQHVYNQRSLALKKLRQFLLTEGEL